VTRSVIAGLDPEIHHYLRKEGMDARVKPGHDEGAKLSY
jgi:hypothetical protein